MDHYSLISDAEVVLRQGLTLLDSVDEDIYSRQDDCIWGSSIGAHYRHVLDHFLCLIEGLWDYEINYDRRGRDREIETSLGVARSTTQDLLEALQSIPPDVLQRNCAVTYNVGYNDFKAQSVFSVVARELMFCVGHAIHHYAIVKLLCSLRGIPLPHEFGMAPSTLKFHQAQAAS